MRASSGSSASCPPPTHPTPLQQVGGAAFFMGLLQESDQRIRHYAAIFVLRLLLAARPAQYRQVINEQSGMPSPKASYTCSSIAEAGASARRQAALHALRHASGAGAPTNPLTLLFASPGRCALCSAPRAGARCGRSSCVHRRPTMSACSPTHTSKSRPCWRAGSWTSTYDGRANYD